MMRQFKLISDGERNSWTSSLLPQCMYNRTKLKIQSALHQMKYQIKQNLLLKTSYKVSVQ